MSTSFSFRWNGRVIDSQDGDTIADALLRAGERATGCSRKRHRAMGHNGTFIQGILAGVDGVPNVRIDQTLAKPGMVVMRQNFWPSPSFDLLKLFRLLPAKLLRGGFEHTRWLPSGTRRFLVWERLLAFLAGEGRLAVTAPAPSVPGRTMVCDVVVVGGGPAGRREANAAHRSGRRVVLAYRGTEAGRFATALGEPLPAIDEGVQVLPEHEVFGIYRNATLVAAAPIGNGPAVAIHCAELILAIGTRSCPPIIPGNYLPGMLDASAALLSAHRPGLPEAFGRTVIVGTAGRDIVADKLRSLGVEIVDVLSTAALRSIQGGSHIKSVDAGKVIACETVVHAGPWMRDPNLPFQAGCDGTLRLKDGVNNKVRLAGSAATADETPHFDPATGANADICPCMDVSAAEIRDLVRSGITHVEELKRQTSCGMGPCQGFPCWDMLAAVLRAEGVEDTGDRPSHRAPRRGLTVAQAAGLHNLVEPQQ